MPDRIRPASPGTRPPEAFVLLHHAGTRLHADYATMNRRADGRLARLVRQQPRCGDLGQTTVFYDHDQRCWIILGLGPAGPYDDHALRRAAGHLVRTLDRLALSRVEIVPSTAAMRPFGRHDFGRILGEGLGLGAFDFRDFKSDKNHAARRSVLHVRLPAATLLDGLADGLERAEAANYARRLSATPPNVATPAYIAAEARRLARRSPRLRCTIHRGSALRSLKLVGLENVGRASRNAPCLVELTWNPPRRARKTLVLIGKTITYDTGGLSLKINNTMKGMKYDKCGGMAVLGAMHAVARVQPRCRVVALLPAAENFVADNAYRPDDILRYPNGVSVEVTNTDAEGRLVLADALVYASQRLEPDAIIDLATLTGGIIVALGRFTAGYWCENQTLRRRLESAAEASGERLWRMPLLPEYRELMKSRHADVWNSAPVRDAHPVQGAAFLSYFVDDAIPWAHIDIAGTANFDRDQMPFTAGPTGFGTRLLIELLRTWS